MKFINSGKFNKKFLICAISYLGIILVLNIFSIAIQNSDENIKNNLKNIPLMLIIVHGALTLSIFFECWLKKTISNKKQEEQNKENIFWQIIYIYYNPRKARIKNFLILILMIFLDYIYDAGIMYYQFKNKKHSELVFGEIYKFLDVFFLYLAFRLFHKVIFYRHQYVAIFIIIFMGLGKFISKLFIDKEFKKNFNDNFDYLFIIAIILFPLIDSIKIYFLQRYMIHHYYSPFFICILIGFIYLLISTIFIFVFNNIDCKPDICIYLSNGEMENPDVGQIFLLIGYSIFYSSEHLMNLITINSFTAFHLILVVTLGELINGLFDHIQNFKLFEFIINIVVSVFQIIGVLVFIEAIELNFCGLNRNLKKNIMFRAGNEVESIYNLQREIGSEGQSEGTNSSINDDSNLIIDNNNTIY